MSATQEESAVDHFEEQVLATLRRVPDRIILATMGRDLVMGNGNMCLCGWFVREKLAEMQNADAGDMIAYRRHNDPGGWASPVDRSVEFFGGTEREWDDIYGGVEDPHLRPTIEGAFVRRVDEACQPKRTSRR